MLNFYRFNSAIHSQMHGMGVDDPKRRLLLRSAKVASERQVRAQMPKPCAPLTRGSLIDIWRKARTATPPPPPPPPLPTPPTPPPPTSRTRGMPQHNVSGGWLASFLKHLTTPLGGRRSVVQAKEVTVDVAKFLYHACPGRVVPELLLDRETIISFSDKLEEVIKASGVQQKLLRLELGIDFLLQSMSAAEAVRQQLDANRVLKTLQVLRKSASAARSKDERGRLADFHPVDLADTKTFLTSGTVTDLLTCMVTALRSSRPVTDRELLMAVLSCAGRLLYW